VFVHVPGETFSMGNLKGIRGHENELPQHEVTLSPFLIAKYEVTQEQWTDVIGSDPWLLRDEQLPVGQVSSDDRMDSRDRVGSSLPMEAQWQYACRAGTRTRYSSGDSDEDMATVGWVRGQFRETAAYRRSEASECVWPSRHARKRVGVVRRLGRCRILRERGRGRTRPSQ